MEFGVSYHPEQWPRENWATDAQRMVESGIEVVRVGEFAWWWLEPRRERISTEGLEEAVGVLGEAGLEVIVATPTAAPPPWLFNRHPNILPQRADGRRWHLGSRRHACINNSAYRKYARRIVGEVAKNLAASPHVRGWQIDNELGLGPGGLCYCDECEQAFRRWLKRRYGTIDRLNRMWGTVFWSQGFSNWHEIPAPRRTPGGPHPSLALDYHRFVSARYRQFAQRQREIIEDYAGPDAVVTVNEPNFFLLPHVNAFALAGEQGRISLNNYPADEGRLEHAALGLNLARSLKRKSFWVMEQQAGSCLIPGHAQQPRPGQLKLWTYQAVAHGASMVNYCRWRTSTCGQEMHWEGMLDADGLPRRHFEEITTTIRELKENAHLWERRAVETPVAILVDYDSAWALEGTPLGAAVDYFGHVDAVFRALHRRGVGVEFVDPEQKLSDYDAVVVPMPFIATEQMANRVAFYARSGGHVLITAPAGMKTPANTAEVNPPRGHFTDLLGVEVQELDRPGHRSQNAISIEGADESYKVRSLCCVVQLAGADCIGRYEKGFYGGSPALTLQPVGQGRAYFLGALGGTELYGAVLDRVLEAADIRTRRWGGECLEIVPLAGEDDPADRALFVLNHSSESASVQMPGARSVKDALSGRRFAGEFTLEGYGVALLEL